jgi:predicted N-formylglutamate amidohydrolase
MLERPAFLISCEHGGNLVPLAYRALFAAAGELLASHRGYDIGILPLAWRFAQGLQAPLLVSQITRLLVDLNRSEGHPALFSELTRKLPAPERQQLLYDYYDPYRQQVRQKIQKLIRNEDAVIHLSVHSFTPILNGKTRSADIGLLYDPARAAEVELCALWQDGLQVALPELRVRRNYPYRGISDGLVTRLRQEFASGQYLGIELEVNQALILQGGKPWERAQRELVETLQLLVE